jgi:hypothetical protein
MNLLNIKEIFLLFHDYRILFLKKSFLVTNLDVLKLSQLLYFLITINKNLILVRLRMIISIIR